MSRPPRLCPRWHRPDWCRVRHAVLGRGVARQGPPRDPELGDRTSGGGDPRTAFGGDGWHVAARRRMGGTPFLDGRRVSRRGLRLSACLPPHLGQKYAESRRSRPNRTGNEDTVGLAGDDGPAMMGRR